LVVADYNHISTSTPFQTLTQRPAGSGPVTHSWESGTEGYVFVPSGTVASGLTWEPENVAKSFDLWIDGSGAGGQTCRVEVTDDTGTMNLGIALFSSNGAPIYQGLGSAAAYADANGVGGSEAIEFTVNAADWYGIVVFNQNASAGTFSIHMWDPTVLAAGDPGSAPLAFDLRTASANPFLSSTNLSFSLTQGGQTDLVIYDIQGRQVKKLVHGEMPAGAHTIAWDGADLSGRAVAPGVYIAKLVSSGSEKRIKLMKAD
jgi:hypothetical protein